MNKKDVLHIFILSLCYTGIFGKQKVVGRKAKIFLYTSMLQNNLIRFLMNNLLNWVRNLNQVPCLMKFTCLVEELTIQTL